MDLASKIVQSFSGLDLDHTEQFISLAETRTISKKTILVKPGQAAEEAFFLKEGVIRHYIIGKNQIEFTKNIFIAPGYFVPSLSAFFLNQNSAIYCQTVTEIEVMSWSRAALFAFAEANPAFYKFLLIAVTHSFQKKEIKEIAINQKETKERYLDFLEDYPGIANTIPMQYIASFLNVRAETLSRIRAALNS